MSPPNLHVTLACPSSGLPELSRRVEQKFFILPQKEPLAFALLRRTCRAESDYPSGQVNSLYFDTPDLDQHQRSDSGEYVKDKVRIRWYGDECDPHRKNGSPSTSGATRIWLELKSRQGFASTKQRVVTEAANGALEWFALGSGIVAPATLVSTMAALGFFAPAPLRPVIAVSYRRHRFVEPRSGFRVSIDSHIRSTVVMPGLGRGERALELPGTIVEVKGPRFEVPRALWQLAEIGSSWTRYSKYSSSIEGHEARGGSVSRLWPSGVMDPCPATLCPVETNGNEERGS